MPFTPEFMQSTSRFRRYCENELVNLLCSSFAEKAQQHGIRLTAELRLPAALSIPDTELCTVLSNGLENAFRAVSGLDEQQRTVSLYCGVRPNKLLLEIKNPYQGEIVMCERLPVSEEPRKFADSKTTSTVSSTISLFSPPITPARPTGFVSSAMTSISG